MELGKYVALEMWWNHPPSPQPPTKPSGPGIFCWVVFMITFYFVYPNLSVRALCLQWVAFFFFGELRFPKILSILSMFYDLFV